MTHCPFCGVQLFDKTSHCLRCGEPLDHKDPGAPARRNADDAPDVAGSEVPESEVVDSTDMEPAASDDDDVAAAAAASSSNKAKGDKKADDPEKLLWEATYSPRAMFGNWIAASVVTVGLLILGIWFQFAAFGWAWLVGGAVAGWSYLFALLLYRRKSVHYELTTHRLVHEKGLLQRVSNRIEVIDISDITYVQGPVERMLGIGSLRILSSDKSHPELMLYGIENVKATAQVVDSASRRQRHLHGVHVHKI